MYLFEHWHFAVYLFEHWQHFAVFLFAQYKAIHFNLLLICKLKIWVGISTNFINPPPPLYFWIASRKIISFQVRLG